MLKNIKNQRVVTNRGITLIALVVTIVVLLILAGITINAILSEGGILNTAKNAQKVQEEASVRETVQVMLSDAQLKKLIENKELGKYIEDDTEYTIKEETDDSITIEDSGYQIKIDKETYQITDMKKTNGSDDENGDNTGDVNEGEEPSNPTVAVTGVSLNKTNVSMPNGGTVNLIATIEPENASNTGLTWTSEDDTVATVSNGVVEALKVGNTKITVTTTDGSFTATCDITVEETVADLIGKSASSTNTYTQDKYGNKIVIPANFIVLGNGGTQSVVYDWDKKEGTSTNVPVVQDGIVIQHATDLNEFVWVPVGNIDNEANVETTNTTEIILGRYDTWTMDTTTTPPTPPSPKQEASKTAYDTVTENDLIGTNPVFENSTGTYDGITYGGAKFTTLGSWISNTIDNRGYYIARYEASYGANGEADSKPSTGTPLDDTASSTTAKTEGQLWTWVSNTDASTASKAMYQPSENLGYYSELVNSYAWDTAIIFIQAYSKNTTYADENSVYKPTGYQPANTGERGATVDIGANSTDKVCNIYDMASNVKEMTTEKCVHPNNLYCVSRGGCFNGYTSWYTRSRAVSTDTGSCYFYTGFRSLLDCNSEN